MACPSTHRATWLMLAAALLLQSAVDQPARAATVCAMNCDYTSINQALLNAPAGESIDVDPGNYSEPRLTVTGRILRSTQPTSPESTIITNNSGQAVIQASNATIEGFTLTGGNNNGGHGGGVAVSGGDVILRNLIIEGNSADSGGGVGGITGGTDVTIENCTIRGNSARLRGGGVEGVPSETTITGSTITQNTVFNGAGSGVSSGGGVYIPQFSAGLIRDTVITTNMAGGSGRGFGSGVFTAGNVLLSGVTIQNNTATNGGSTSRGGGLYINRQGATSVYGGAISGNSAGRGGGVYVGGGNSVVSLNTAISSNTATEPTNFGGGVYCESITPATLTISGTVSGNTPDQVTGCGVAINPPLGTTRTESDNNQSGNTNDPVNTVTGALYQQHDPDIDLGGPMPLRLSRYYSSIFKQVGLSANVGDNWRHNFDWRLNRIDDTLNIVDHRGRTIQFVANGMDWDLAGKLDVAYQLTENVGEFTLLDPRNQMSYVFDSAGLLTTLFDGRGNVHTLSYADGPLTQVSDGLGRVLDFSYDADNRVTGVSDGLGRNLIYSYTGTYLTGVTHLDGQTTTYNYSTAHPNLTNWGLLTTQVRPEGNTPFEHRYWFADRMSSSELDSNMHQTIFTYISATETTITDPLGNVRTHTHSATGELTNSTDNADRDIVIGADSTGRRNSITDRLGDMLTLSYHAPSGLLESRMHADGATETFSYTARAIGNNTAYDLTGITHADLTTESFVYDAQGNLTDHVDQLGNPATFTYGTFGQPLTATNRSGGEFMLAYNPDRTVDTTTDPAGNVTTFSYDGFRRVSRTTYQDGSEVDTSYDDADRLLTLTDENNNTLTFGYDLNGNLASIEDPLTQTTTFTYDGNDRLLSVTRPRGGVTSQTYDELGRIGTTTDPLTNVTTFGYDIHNRLTAITDPLMNLWTTGYDLEGVLASTTDPLMNTTTFGSDEMGRITRVTTPLGHETDIGYDLMGRIETITDGLDRTTTFSYDPRGLLEATALPEAISTSYARDDAGLITTLTDPNNNDWTRGYDTSARLISRTDPLLQTTTFSYDDRNRPAMLTYPGALGSVTRTYDPAGNLTDQVYTDGTTLGYAYDANSRMTSAHSGGPDDVTRSYDPDGLIDNSNGIAITRDLKGRITGMTLAPGKALTYAYDANDRLTSVTDWAAATLTFSYDAAGRLTGITRPNGVDTTYGWDNDSRLVSLSETGLSSITLTRDAAGQVRAASRSVPEASSATALADRSHTYDAAAQLQGASYDEAGRLTASGADTYTWDLASRLTSYQINGETVTNVYDALGRRIQRTRAGITRNHVWNEALGLPSVSIERDGPTDLRYFIHTPGGHLLYAIDATTDARQYLHYDEAGNTIAVTDDAGTTIGSYAYTPFGELIAATGALDLPFTWQGKLGVMDEGNGLYYLRARYYESTTNRFISRDPVDQIDPRSVNPYQYAWANPLNFVDPQGRQPSRLDINLAIAEADLAVAEAEYDAVQADYDAAYVTYKMAYYAAGARYDIFKSASRKLKRARASNNTDQIETLDAAHEAAGAQLDAASDDFDERAAELDAINEVRSQAGSKEFDAGQKVRDALRALEAADRAYVNDPLRKFSMKFAEQLLDSQSDAPTSRREAVMCPINPDQVDGPGDGAGEDDDFESVLSDLTPVGPVL